MMKAAMSEMIFNMVKRQFPEVSEVELLTLTRQLQNRPSPQLHDPAPGVWGYSFPLEQHHGAQPCSSPKSGS